MRFVFFREFGCRRGNHAPEEEKKKKKLLMEKSRGINVGEGFK